MRSLCVAAAALWLSAACAGDGAGGRRVLEGVVLEVEARSLGDVESFTIKDGDETHEVFLDPRATYEFPPSHLSEHRLSGAPVRTEVEKRDGRLVAVTLEDV